MIAELARESVSAIWTATNESSQGSNDLAARTERQALARRCRGSRARSSPAETANLILLKPRLLGYSRSGLANRRGGGNKCPKYPPKYDTFAFLRSKSRFVRRLEAEDVLT